MEKDYPLKKSEKISLVIDGVTHSGDGVGRCRGLAVFVPGAAPGETVVAEVADLKKNHAVARLLEITRPSPARRDPPCPRFSACGGCRLQHLDYGEQLRVKTGLVRDSLARIAGLGDVQVMDTLGMDNPWHYRNKAHFQVDHGPGGLALGFYQEGSHSLSAFFSGGDSPGTPVPGCLLVDDDLNRVARTAGDLLNRHGNGLSRVGRNGGAFFRRLVLRKAFSTGEIMAVLVTGSGEWPRDKDFARDLLALHPGVTSLVRNINPGPPGPVMGRKNLVLAGSDHITDRLGGLSFIISPDSFYQVNPAQTLVLYRKALEYAGPKRQDTVVDAYCGIGAIALFMAGRSGKVYGLEEVPGAVEDARLNAGINGIDNVEFLRGEVEKILPGLASRGLRPDVAVLDPPRRGCRREVLEALVTMAAPRVVYVSCDPGTLARDLGILAAGGYRVREVQPVDMFPWTRHIECVASLHRAGL